jgi:hypothetical protein
VIDLSRFNVLRKDEDCIEEAERVLGMYTPDNPPLLSDLELMVGTGPVFVKRQLEQNYKSRDSRARFRWRIRVLKDKWGNSPSPGDVITLKMQRSLQDSKGRAFTQEEMSNAKRMGTYDGKYNEVIEYVIDDKGCFECEFEQAVVFIRDWGVHPRSRLPVTIKPEYSKHPVDANGETKIHKHHWLYMECPKDDYAKLPTIQKTDTHKRGQR